MTQKEIIINLTGMRDDDINRMRPCDIDRGKEIWEYNVPGKNRVIFIGPKCQRELGPLLDAATDQEKSLFNGG